MKIRNSFPQFLLAAILVACSTKNIRNTNQEHLDGVEIKTTIPEVKNENTIPQIGGEIKTEGSNEQMLPVKVEVRPGINMMIGPGGYHSFGLVGFFKSLEKKHIKIKEISGFEMGGVIAALYAKHRKSSVVEWELFKLINKLDEDEALYTPHWNQVMGEFIKRNFSGVDFSDLKIELKIASLTRNGEVEWIESGNVANALIDSLKIKPNAYKNFIWPQKLEGEEFISVDILSSNLQYKQKMSEQFYQDFLGLIKEMKKQSSEFVNLKFTQGYVDSYKNWQNNGPVAQTYGTQLAKTLQEKNQKTE